MFVDLLIPFTISLVLWLIGGVSTPRPQAAGPLDRSFGVFVLTLAGWLGWIIALICLLKLGPPTSTPAALVAVSGSAGAAVGVWISLRLNPTPPMEDPD